MRFVVRRQDMSAVAVVVVPGELDVASVGPLEHDLHKIPEAMPVVLDLSATHFIDISGLRMILRERLRRRGRVYIVSASPGPMTRILEASRSKERLSSYRTLGVAVLAAQIDEATHRPEASQGRRWRVGKETST
jgi:anti-anti-sigma factor